MTEHASNHVNTKDNTGKIEAKIQRRLLLLSNGRVMQESVYKENRSAGSLRLRLYGLPKVHKKEVPPTNVIDGWLIAIWFGSCY